MKIRKILFFGFILLGLFFCIKENPVKAESLNKPSGTMANGDYYYYIDVTDEVMVEDVATNIKLEAFDEYDGDLTNAIKVDDVDEYQLKVPDLYVEERILGTYKLIYTVMDSSGNMSTLNVFVVVEDKKPPIFDESSTIYYEEDIDNCTLSEERVFSNIKANDEYYEDNITKEIVEGDLHNLQHVKDIEQHITVKIADKAGNFILQDVVVVLKDRTKPNIITDSDTVTTSYFANSSINTLINSLNTNVTDNYDEEIGYIIKNDNYTEFKNKVGNYTVDLEATDSSNNVATKTITIKVTDTIPPVFYLDISKVFVKPEVKLSNDDFLSLLKQEGKIRNEEYEFFILEDEYSNNYKEEGEYNYRCRVSYNEDDYDDFKFLVNVKKDAKKHHRNFFQSFIYVNKKIANLIWNILKWPILKMKELF